MVVDLARELTGRNSFGSWFGMDLQFWMQMGFRSISGLDSNKTNQEIRALLGNFGFGRGVRLRDLIGVSIEVWKQWIWMVIDGLRWMSRRSIEGSFGSETKLMQALGLGHVGKYQSTIGTEARVRRHFKSLRRDYKRGHTSLGKTQNQLINSLKIIIYNAI